mmetsp:Transcript_13729/g.20733  ORF Transcript_13729/g.20733 Transcript_13729/m.20733 type:complete len:405 (-) Transcript_13729:171-1385(-)
MPEFKGEDSCIGMGYPSKLIRNREMRQGNTEAKEKLIVDSNKESYSEGDSNLDEKIVDTDFKVDEVKVASIGDIKGLSDALRKSNVDAEPENREETEAVKEPTFRVNLKMNSKEGKDSEYSEMRNKTEDVIPVELLSADRKTTSKVVAFDGYTFTHLASAKFDGFEKKETKEYFQKWGIKFHISKYRFHESFDESETDIFLRDFFSSKDVQKIAKKSLRKGASPTAQLVDKPVTKVDTEEVSTTLTSMGFFDRLKEEGVVANSGRIRGCFEEMIEEVACNSVLRKALWDEDDDNYEVFDDSERSELLFLIFRMLVFGGGHMCQYEDYVKPYLDTCKQLYKDLVAVSRDANTGRVSVKTHTLRIKKIQSSTIFPIEHDLNLCLVCVDKLRKYATLLYVPWGGSAW